MHGIHSRKYMCMAACKGRTDSMHDSDSYLFLDVKRDLCISKRPMNIVYIVYMCMAACKGRTDSMHDSDSYF